MTAKPIAIFLTAMLLAASLAACQPSNDPPPDIIKTQREALQKARAVSSVEQKAADAQQKAVDEQTKQTDDASK